MARQEAVCWSCGTRRADEDVPLTALRVIAGGAGRDETESTFATAVAEAHAPRASAPIDADRWIIDGGSFEAEAAAEIRLTTARR